MTLTPHKEKMTCDGKGKVSIGAHSIGPVGPEGQEVFEMEYGPCPGCIACSPKKEKREDAGEDVCGECDLPLKGPVSCQGLHGHSTPRPSQETKKNPYDRWEKGTPHLPLSKAIYDVIEKMDFENGDSFCWKSGGDGDNGENLMYLLDEMLDTPGNPIALALDHAKAEERDRVHDGLRDVIDSYPYDIKGKSEVFGLIAGYFAGERSALSIARKEDGN